MQGSTLAVVRWPGAYRKSMSGHQKLRGKNTPKFGGLIRPSEVIFWATKNKKISAFSGPKPTRNKASVDP